MIFFIREKSGKQRAFFLPPPSKVSLDYYDYLIKYKSHISFDLALNFASNGIVIFAVITIPGLVRFCCTTKNWIISLFFSENARSLNKSSLIEVNISYTRVIYAAFHISSSPTVFLGFYINCQICFRCLKKSFSK